jgi:hypothetical protein
LNRCVASLVLVGGVLTTACAEKRPYRCEALFDRPSPVRIAQGPHHVAAASEADVALLLVTQPGAVPHGLVLHADGELAPPAPLGDLPLSTATTGVATRAPGGFAVAWRVIGGIALRRMATSGDIEDTELFVATTEVDVELRHLHAEGEALVLVWETPEELLVTRIRDDEAPKTKPLTRETRMKITAQSSYNHIDHAMVWDDDDTTQFARVTAEGAVIGRRALSTPPSSAIQLRGDAGGFALYDVHRERPNTLGFERLATDGTTRVARRTVELDHPIWFGSSAARFRAGTVLAAMREGTGGPLVHAIDFYGEVVDSFDFQRDPENETELRAQLPDVVVIGDRVLVWWHEFLSPEVGYEGFAQLSRPCEG